MLFGNLRPTKYAIGAGQRQEQIGPDTVTLCRCLRQKRGCRSTAGKRRRSELDRLGRKGLLCTSSAARKQSTMASRSCSSGKPKRSESMFRTGRATQRYTWPWRVGTRAWPGYCSTKMRIRIWSTRKDRPLCTSVFARDSTIRIWCAVDLRQVVRRPESMPRITRVITPLHLALLKRHRRVAEFLLRRGANPTLTNGAGSTALHLVCERNDDLAQVFFRINRQLANPRHRVRLDALDNLGLDAAERGSAPRQRGVGQIGAESRCRPERRDAGSYYSDQYSEQRAASELDLPGIRRR
ncbi:unnamed protein product [Trichogramma brassicae]|uniref:Uncharacterized protein n=1 Tax=Trichogramma brassicae TaxID=86971 RepID=A0A6H5IQ57_9HYME|nr:unnamed protein product [Trichogramma brassicae]